MKRETYANNLRLVYMYNNMRCELAHELHPGDLHAFVTVAKLIERATCMKLKWPFIFFAAPTPTQEPYILKQFVASDGKKTTHIQAPRLRCFLDRARNLHGAVHLTDN